MKNPIGLHRQKAATPIITNQLPAIEQQTKIGLSSGTVFSGHELSRISLRPQAKLRVSQPGDAYEREADTVAQKVMGMSESNLQRQKTQQAEAQPQLQGKLMIPSLQREAAPDEEELQMKADDNFSIQREVAPDEEELQMKPDGNLFIQREAAPDEEELQMKADGNLSIQREAAPDEEELQMKPDGNLFIQREAAPDEEEVQMKADGNLSIQREAAPDEEEVQMKADGNLSIQREAAPDEEEVQMKADGNLSIQREAAPDKEELQMKTTSSVQRAGDGGLTASNDISSQLHSRRGGGSPLGENVRSFMEPRFGVDFSNVNVHTDGEAVQMTKAVGAQAFAYGSDVYFGAGKSPGNNELTAHELTHVVQQTGGGGKLMPKRTKLTIESGTEQIQRWSFKKAFKAAKSAVKQVKTSAKKGASFAKQGFKLVVKKVKTGAKAIGSGIAKGVKAAIKKLGGIFGPILELKKILVKVLAGAGSAIPKILKNPVAFVKSLFRGLGQGFKSFGSQIAKHLQKGLQTFLFGSLGNLNFKLPQSFNSEGLLSIAAQLTGLSHDKIRAKAVGKLGEEKVSLIEQGTNAAQTGNVAGFAKQQAVSKLGADNANLIEQGANAAQTGKAAGFAKQQAVSQLGPEKQRQLQEAIRMFQALRAGAKGMFQYFSNLNFGEMSKLVIDGLKTYLIEQVMSKGVTKIVASLTPGAGWVLAAIDALRMMYGLFIERAEQLKELSAGVTKSVVEAAQHNVGGVSQKLEDALGKSVPMLIGILGDYVGIGDISKKVKQFLARGSDWVNKNITPVIDRVLDSVSGLF